jgi:hypothetical protein
MDTVKSALPEGWELRGEEETSGYKFDGLIKSDAKTIAVEAFYNPTFSGGAVSRAISRAYREKQVNAVLVVAVSRAAPGFRRLEGDCTGLGLPHQILEWQPEQLEDLVLTGAVRNLIRTLQRNGRPT